MVTHKSICVSISRCKASIITLALILFSCLIGWAAYAQQIHLSYCGFPYVDDSNAYRWPRCVVVQYSIDSTIQGVQRDGLITAINDWNASILSTALGVTFTPGTSGAPYFLRFVQNTTLDGTGEMSPDGVDANGYLNLAVIRSNPDSNYRTKV